MMRHPLASLANSPKEWKIIFEETLARLCQFMAAREPFEVLARTASLRLWGDQPNSPAVPTGIEQADVEVLQAIALMQSSPIKHVPTSPRNFERIWPEVSKHVFAFAKMQPPLHQSDPAMEFVVGRVRMQTLYYRYLFTRTDCEDTVHAILSRMNDAALRELGASFSSAFAMLLSIVTIIEERITVFLNYMQDTWNAKDEGEALEAIRFFCQISPLAKRAWKLAEGRCTTLETLRWAGLQLCDISHSWMYTLKKSDLDATVGRDCVPFLERISLRPRGVGCNESTSHLHEQSNLAAALHCAIGEKFFSALARLNLRIPIFNV